MWCHRGKSQLQAALSLISDTLQEYLKRCVLKARVNMRGAVMMRAALLPLVRVVQARRPIRVLEALLAGIKGGAKGTRSCQAQGSREAAQRFQHILFMMLSL